MPTYQYACTECGHQFETVQSFSDDALTECPQCTGRLRKVFNAVGIVFKGSGFYRNDSREKAAAGAGKADQGDKGSADKGATGDKGSGSTSSDSPAAAGSTTGAGPAKPSSPKPASTSTGSSTKGSAA